MLDCHCHLDHYPNPNLTSDEAARRGVFTIAVTNLPSHFRAGLAHVRRLKRVRLAVGLHPLAAPSHATEISIFREMLRHTSFVGEVGLDFSRHGKATRDEQLKSFRFVTDEVARAGGKVISLHSRGAESEVLDVLTASGIREAIFHWYSGSLRVLDRALSAGHYFSINPAMTLSTKGREIIANLPAERVLTESDGPYAQLRGKPAMPWDVTVVEDHLSDIWGKTNKQVRIQIWANFQQLIQPIRPTENSDHS